VVVDTVTPGFLKTLGISLVKGREFDWSDDKTAAPVLMVNEAFVHDYLKGRDPIGAGIRMGGTWRTIVGVHRNYIYRHPYAPQRPAVFLPLAQDYNARAIVVARTRTDPSLAAVPFRQVLQGFDRHLPVARIMTMEENVGNQFVEARIATGTLIVFGIIASTLAAIGFYGVLNAFVKQRRREFGVRSALGAAPGDLRRLVISRSARLVLMGVGLGLLLSIGFARVLRSALAGLTAFDPLVYAGGSLFVAIIAVLATFVPSRAAGRTDPIVALRHE